MYSTKKKIIIISIIVVAIVIVGLIAGIIIHNVSVKKEEERLKNATQIANQAYNNLVETKQKESDQLTKGDLFGYTIIVNLGDKYSDYLFMVEKTELLEFKAKVNFNEKENTVVNKDKSEYLLLGPDGKRYSLSRYTILEPEAYNTEDVYIYYGNSKMGFFDSSMYDEPSVYDDYGNINEDEIPEDPVYNEEP